MSEFNKQYINKRINEFKEKVKKLPPVNAKKLTRPQFNMLLAAPKALENRISFFSFRMKDDDLTKQKVKNKIKDIYHITDRKTAIQALTTIRYAGAGNDGLSFSKIWNEKKAINNPELGVEANKRMNACRKFAANFGDVIPDGNFYAWDIAEAIHLVRDSHAAGCLEDSICGEIISDFSSIAIKSFKNFEEYAISYVCGGSYKIFKLSGDEKMAAQMFDKLFEEIDALFFEEATNGFREFAWYELPKFFAQTELKTVVDTDEICVVSNRISVNNKPVRMIYGIPNPAAKGKIWAFLSGDETEEYLMEGANTNAFPVNYMCCYDEKIIDIVKNGDKDLIYKRNEKGEFVSEDSDYIIINNNEYERYIIAETEDKAKVEEIFNEYSKLLVKDRKYDIKISGLPENKLTVIKCPDDFSDGYYFNFGLYAQKKYDIKSFNFGLHKEKAEEDFFTVVDEYNLFDNSVIGAFEDGRTFFIELNEGGMKPGKISLGETDVTGFISKYKLNRKIIQDLI